MQTPRDSGLGDNRIGRKNKKGYGHEYWSPRFPKMRDPGKDTKVLTHRQERRKAKIDVRGDTDE